VKTVTASELQERLESSQPRDWALIDIRERGESDSGHIFSSTFLPRRMLEFRIGELVPDKTTSIVLYDDDDGRAALSQETLGRLGYDRVERLEGGMPGWQSHGGAVATGTNVPSKAFGERVHVREHPPTMSPQELRAALDQGENILICDVRTPGEYAEGHIPGGYEAPSFDLVLGAFDLGRDYDRVVLNCAGRTRSIMATRTLQLLGISNATGLENGTSGWLLEDWELERETMRSLPEPSAESAAQAAARAKTLALEAEVGTISPAEAAAQAAEGQEKNIYFFDVRSLAAYRDGHAAPSRPLPGGQALQRADDFIVVPTATIFLIDDDDARAWLTGYWLRRMGFPEVSVVAGGLPAWREANLPVATGRVQNPPLTSADAPVMEKIGAAELHKLAEGGEVTILDVGSSREYARGHLPKARWLPRSWLELHIGDLASTGQKIVVTAARPEQARLGAEALARIGYTDVQILEDGNTGWERAGFEITPGEPTESFGGPDFVLPPYEQGREGMLRYLKWEIALYEDGAPDAAEIRQG